MYRVAIIDDEPIIVEGISRTIDWSKYGAEVAGFAYDGLEGLEFIRREKPDMIISDIRMPGIDGLRMIAALKSEFPGIQITILTGYRDFEYAQQAIRLGVTRFLLKPSKLAELEEAVAAMKQRLDLIAEHHSYERQLDELAGYITGEETGKNGEKEGPQEENTAAEEAADFEDKAFEHDPAGSFIVNNAVAYIREHYSEKLRLMDVADEIYVSQWHLSKLLNRYTGSNFSEILNGVRVEKAKELLKDPALKIYDVAEKVGFNDLTHFSRVFKKLEGISANEYRNRI